MDAVDASTHYEISSSEESPSLLTIILDTNPRAWAALNDVLPLSKAIAHILVLVNSHLALSSGNQVALLASHAHRAVWLYPSPPKEDVEMTDRDGGDGAAKETTSSANKFPQFAELEKLVLASIRELVTSTTEADLGETTTLISGAITLALAHVNKAALSSPTAQTSSSKDAQPSSSDEPTGLHARILIISVSDSAASQYIPTMNAVFAASHSHIAIDVLSLHGSATFLQQASYITRGTFIQATEPQGLLTYLMFGFSATSSRIDATKLISPSADAVDFRAACFCHRRVVDTGFVCSICLSIFCEIPASPDGGAAECLTCGTRLALGRYGNKPAVIMKPKKKRKKRLDGEREGTGTASVAGTPG